MQTGIEIKTEFFPLAWFLHFVTPIIEINGEKHKKKWGETFFSLPPGEYQVKISFPYLAMAECGANEITVPLSEGQKRIVKYYMPPWVMLPGNIKMS